MQSPFPYKPNPEIERIFCIRRKKQRCEKRHKAQRTSPKMDTAIGGQRRTLQDFILLEFKAFHQA